MTGFGDADGGVFFCFGYPPWGLFWGGGRILAGCLLVSWDGLGYGPLGKTRSMPIYSDLIGPPRPKLPPGPTY